MSRSQDASCAIWKPNAMRRCCIARSPRPPMVNAVKRCSNSPTSRISTPSTGWPNSTEYGVRSLLRRLPLSQMTQPLVARARALGLVAVLGTLEEAEGADAGMYDDEPEALPTMPSDEREHAEVFPDALKGEAGEIPAPGDGTQTPVSRGSRLDKSGSIRAAIFGVSDGLVSNTALVMGFAGHRSQERSTTRGAVRRCRRTSRRCVLDGGRRIRQSMASQRDLFRREIDMET